MWHQATLNHITYPPCDGNGWKQEQNPLQIDWDSEENITKVRTRVALLKKDVVAKQDVLQLGVCVERAITTVVQVANALAAAIYQKK